MRVGIMMKRKIMVCLMTLVALSSNTFAHLSVEGHYQGKNLFIQSPLDDDGFGYCVYKVTVNGVASTASYQSSAFQIDLTEFNIQFGDPVLVVVEHGEGCKPKLLNPEVLLPASTFVLTDIACTQTGILTWSTTGESGKLPYQIEQYKWNKWVVIGEVNGLGSNDKNNYTFQVSPHSGENKVRVSQIDNTGNKRVSREVTFVCESCPEPEMKKTDEEIVFENNGKRVETKYEIYDAYGNIIKKGMSASIACDKLKHGVYHINYDNKNEKYIKH